jgi:peptide/nickel transport system substrate-binding protein
VTENHSGRWRGRRQAGVIAMLCVLTAGACSSSGTPGASAGSTLTFAASDEPPGFNLNKAENETPTTRDLAENIFFYASKVDPSFRKVFVGLEEAPVVLSTQPQVVEWRIKQEAVWDDGTPVTSEDLRYFRELLIDDESLSVEHEGYDQMSDVSAVDAKTLRITFEKPYGDYESLFNGVPQAAFLKAQPGGFNTGLDESPGPSAGPYRFEEWKRGESISLVRNPRWWGTPDPALERIVFRFITDPSAQVDALVNGEVDMIAPDPDVDLIQQVQEASAGRDIRHSLSFGPNWDLLTFNVRNPILADVNVRRAMIHAIDRNAMLDKILRPISPQGRRLDNFVYMTNHPDYEPHGQQYANADPDAARRLLDQAGWTVGSDGIREKGGNKLSVRIMAPAGFTRFEQAADLASSQLAPLGIQLRSDNCAVDCVLERATKGDFDVLSAGWLGNISTASLIRGIFATSGNQNFGKFSSIAFDELIDQALAVPEARQQAPLANRADEVLWSEVPGLPLYQVPTLFAVDDRFEGVADNPNGDGIFWNSHTWSRKG